MNKLSSQVRPDRIVYSMRALGKQDPPESFVLDGLTWKRTQIIKHDFYAATAFYIDPQGRKAVLKIGRTIDFAGFPLMWLGRYLCRREMNFYRKLSKFPNVPRLLGSVGPTGFLHEYIEGHPLSKAHPVPDGFFAQLQQLFNEIHPLGIAYVDTNKPQNILQGDDGKPYLIDFQISWDVEELYNTWLNRWFLNHLWQTDHYHILKHKNRLRPDEMTDEEKERLARKHWTIHLHRFITKPYFKFRRRTFKRLRATGQLMPEGSK